jgi:CYTH domain-containing protein
MFEIERKFLINDLSFLKDIDSEKSIIAQGYLFEEDCKSLRIRIKNTKAFITLKFGDTGLIREEFEVEISLQDGKRLLEKCSKVLEKHRYTIRLEEVFWEIDVFQGGLLGLCLAEVELMDCHQSIDIPYWIGEEVTNNPEYLNINLIKRL